MYSWHIVVVFWQLLQMVYGSQWVFDCLCLENLEMLGISGEHQEIDGKYHEILSKKTFHLGLQQ